MSSFIGLIIGGGLVCLLLVWQVNTKLMDQTKKKHDKIAKHKQFIMKLQRVFDNTPNNFLSRDLKLNMLGELIEHLQQWQKLDSGNEQVKQQLTKRLQQKQEALSTKQSPSLIKTNDVNEAMDLRKRLMDLHKYVSIAKKNRKISGADASKELQTIKKLFVETATHTFLSQAKIAKDQNNKRLAIHNYGRAITEFQKANNAGQYNKQITELKETLSHLQGRPTEAEKKKKNAAQSELNKAMDKFPSGPKKMKY